ncbi:MAG: ATP-binding protein [Armatimonadota bacterium]
MAPLPDRALLFTDIEGSTRLWEEHPEAMRFALAEHDRIVRSAIEQAGGSVFKTIGDAFCAVFPTCESAVDAAGSAQETLGAAVVAGQPLRVRMAVHAGEVEERDGDYFGPPLNLVARLLAAGHGGQILISDTALGRLGDQAGKTRFLGRHRLRDIARTVAVHQWIVPGAPRDFPPLRSVAERNAPGNLPHPRTSFVGRESALRDLAERARRHRLATLIGAGGCGKSRLLLQHGLEQRDRHPDGAWWIDLAEVGEGARVADAFARPLEVPDSPDHPIELQIVEHLRDRELLLLVDNCEHLVNSVAALVGTVLMECPRIRVVAASREALGVPGECRVPVAPLALPPEGRTTSVASLEAHEATRLFLERARLRRPDFHPEAAEAAAVARVCRRLDGIPLAIELAAARIGTLSVAQIDARLDRRFRLLTGGDRAALPRQQTLRSLIDWSYDLLGADERIVFHRLATFHGGWDLDAAEGVASGGSIHEDSVLDHLETLVDKSLVATRTNGDRVRYHLLESLRAYALERLDADADGNEARDRHAQTYAELVHRAAGGLAGPAARDLLERIDDERENVAAALDRLPGDAAGRMCADLEEYWHRRGRWREAVERIGDVVARVTDPRERGRLLGIRGWFSHLRGDREAARADTDAALSAALATGDLVGEAAARNTSAFLAWSDGDRLEAKRLFESSLERLREAGEPARAAGRLANLGLLAAETGDFTEAATHLRDASEAYSSAGDLQGVAACLCNLADVALRRGEPVEAETCAAEGAVLFARLHDGPGVVYSLANRAEAALARNVPSEALAHVDAALGEFHDPGMRSLLPLLLDLRVRALAGLGDGDAARVWWRRANGIRRAEGQPRDPATEAAMRAETGFAGPGDDTGSEEEFDVESWLEDACGAR